MGIKQAASAGAGIAAAVAIAAGTLLGGSANHNPPAAITPPSLSTAASQGAAGPVDFKLAGAFQIAVHTTLKTTNGTWTNSPTGYAYQWQDCNSSGASCTNISGATAQTYRVQTADEGFTVVSKVTASNSFGSAAQSSTHTNVIAGGGASAPVNTTGNYFTASTGTTSAVTAGAAIQGQTLGTDNGTWTNCTSCTYSYQWFRGTTTTGQPPTTTGTLTSISGATAATYTVTSSDLGHALIPVVTATNSGGSASTSSTSTCDTGFIPSSISFPVSDVITITIASPNKPAAGCAPISAEAATTQAGEKFCTNAPTTCGYADPMNGTMGVPAGTGLSTTGSCSSGSVATAAATASSTINGCLITGGLSVTANNVTVENSDISASNDTGQCVTADGNTGDQFIDDTVHGVTNLASGDCAWAFKLSNATITGVWAYNVDRIVTPFEGPPLTGAGNPGSTITVHNSGCWGNAYADAEHRECFYEGGDTNVNIDSSMLFNLSSETAAFFGDAGNNTGNPMNNACSCTGLGNYALTNNIFSGGGYEVYGNGNQTVARIGTMNVSNNRFTRLIYALGGQFSISDGVANPTQSGNIFDDTALSTGTLT